MPRKKSLAVLAAILVMIACLFPHPGEAAPYKVLVVMSYHESYPWGMEIKEGIDAVLGGSSTLKYVYLDTKNNAASGAEKANKFYELYRDFRPDGVIAADDAAQSLFVVPYLKNKVPTPVMFCGVNKEPEVYGYPAANVSGVLERVHIKESLALLQQLSPSVKSFGCIMKDDPSSRGILTQIHQESGSYSARFAEAGFPRTLVEAVAMVKKMKPWCDALFLTPMDGLKGVHGEALTTQEVTPVLARAFGKPTTSENSFNVRAGVLCAVIKTGQEQGSTAAKMLLKAMDGTPVKELPITRNQYGKRMINVTVMNRLKIKPKPYVLIGTEFVEEAK